MENNIILRKIRYIFDFSDSKMIEIFQHANFTVSRAEISDWLKKEEDEAFAEITDRKLAIFLNGLIILNRGKKDDNIPSPEERINNNIVFKKIKIALNLQSEEIIQLFESVDMKVSKNELSAFFRNPKQSQFRPCKDQYLRNFLLALQLKYRPKD